MEGNTYMRKIRVILLTLILSISMLAPELSMIPAAYAQDETPALTQSAENTGAVNDAAGADDSENPAGLYKL